jgi:hypothetical protein
MKKVINLILAVLITGCINAQWNYKTINNGFDDPFKIAYVQSNDYGLAKLENVNSSIVFYIQDTYFCDDYPSVDIVFTINGVDKKYHLTGDKSNDNTTIFLTWDFESLPELLKDFKAATLMKVRINESYCTENTYSFKMTNTTLAYDFMKN